MEKLHGFVEAVVAESVVAGEDVQTHDAFGLATAVAVQHMHVHCAVET